MSRMWNQELSSILALSDADADLLRQQQIHEEQPGSVLRDFETLLDFVGEQGYVTTSRYLMLPQARLAELNERMTHPVVQRLKRPVQKSFPNLHGLFLILRASGLGTAVAAGSKKRLMVEPESRAVWTHLNPTERYFTLLESWIVHSSPEIIAGGIGGADQLTSVGWIWQKLRETRTEIEPRNRIGLL